mgnify:CR=1 FL=1
MGSREDDSNRETRELALAQQEIEAKWTALKESNLRRAEALPSGNGGCYRQHTYKLFNHGEFNEHSICTRCGYKNPYTQQGFSTGALNLLSSHSSCNRCNSKNTEQKIIVAGYYPSYYEVDILNFLEKASKKKFKIVLPVIKSSNAMSFKSWVFKEPLYVNQFGILEPEGSKKGIIPAVSYTHLTLPTN